MTSKKIAILGAGSSGLAAALEASLAGYAVNLYEQHSIPGGCSSWYRRSTEHGSFQFDVGATVLNGLEDGQALKLFLDKHAIKDIGFQKMPYIRYQIPTEDGHARSFDFDTSSTEAWTQSLLKAFPHDQEFLRAYLPPLRKLAERLYISLTRPVHWPMQSFSDLSANLKHLPNAFGFASPILQMGALDFGSLLARHSLSPELRCWLDMTFLISAQCKPEDVALPWASLVLYFYPLGAGTTESGMRGLMEALFRSLKERDNVRVHMRTKVQGLQPLPNRKWQLQSSKSEEVFDAVISTLPSQNTTELMGIEKLVLDKDKLWGAMTCYLGLKDQDSFPDKAFNIHSTLGLSEEAGFSPEAGGEVYMSFSRRGDTSRAPEGYRSMSLSTHMALSDHYKKKHFEAQVMKHLERAGINLNGIVHLETGTPKTFEFFTARKWGNVGGLPMTVENTLMNARPQRSSFSGLYQIGDTVFPGQSVFACVMGAQSVLEKIQKEL